MQGVTEIVQQLKDEKDRRDQELIDWAAEYTLPTVRVLFRKLKSRNIRGGISIRQGMGCLFPCGAGEGSLDHDRVYQFWVHNEAYLEQRWPELGMLLELMNELHDVCDYQVGDLY